MRLSGQSVKKLIRENISNNPAMEVEPLEIKKTLDMMRSQLLTIAGVTKNEVYYRRSEDEDNSIHFNLREAGDDDSFGWRTYQFSVCIKQNIVMIKLDGESHEDQGWLPLPNINELINYIRAYQAGLQRRRAKGNKREKVRNLKVQAMIAQIKQIAKQEQFDFLTESDNIKMKLYINILDAQWMELHIPFSKFQTLLPEIPMVIRSLRAIQRTGINFKIGRPYYDPQHVIKYKDL